MIIVDFVQGLIQGFNAVLAGLQWFFTLIINIFTSFGTIINFITSGFSYLFDSSGELGGVFVPSTTGFQLYFMPVIIFTCVYCVFRFIVKIFK